MAYSRRFVSRVRSSFRRPIRRAYSRVRRVVRRVRRVVRRINRFTRRY